MYKLKEKIDLSKNGQVTDRIEIKNNILIIQETDKVELRSIGWFINNVYQGKDAQYQYTIQEPITKELFDIVFEEIK